MEGQAGDPPSLQGLLTMSVDSVLLVSERCGCKVESPLLTCSHRIRLTKAVYFFVVSDG
jgi:hypothetical protein